MEIIDLYFIAQETIAGEVIKRKVNEKIIRNEAFDIISNMASDFRLHSAVQPSGYLLVKIFRVFIILKINSPNHFYNIRKYSLIYGLILNRWKKLNKFPIIEQFLLFGYLLIKAT